MIENNTLFDLHMVLMAGVLQIVVGMFVAVLVEFVTMNEVLQVNDGTSGTEATTEKDRFMVFPFTTAAGASSRSFQSIDALAVPLYVTSHVN